MTLGERIRLVRMENRLTLDKFGERLGITKSSLSHIESGRRNPSDQTIRSICREFHIREEWLRDGTGEMREPDAGEELETAVSRMLSGESSEFRRRLVGILTRLSSDQWKQFEGYVLELSTPTSEKADGRGLTAKDWDAMTREEKIAEFARQLDEEEASGGEGGQPLGGATA